MQKYNFIAGIYGDPHILTFTKGVFKIDKEGFIRLFDNNDKDHRIIINGQAVPAC